MLYSLFLNFVETFSFLNIFKYLTVRTGLAMFTSMLVVIIIGTPFIKFFSSKQIHNPIREAGPEDHIIKKNRNTHNGRSANFTWIVFWGFIMGRFVKSIYLVFNVYSWILWFVRSLRRYKKNKNKKFKGNFTNI